MTLSNLSTEKSRVENADEKGKKQRILIPSMVIVNERIIQQKKK